MKVSQSEQTLEISIVMVEDGQRLDLRLTPGETRKLINCRIGPNHFVGELVFERFETSDPNDNVDVRVRMCIPPGASDRPALGLPLLTATAGAMGKIQLAQELKAKALPQAEDGAAFLIGPNDVAFEPEMTGTLDEPGVPDAAELGGVVDSPDGAVVVAKRNELEVIAAEKMFTAPEVGEEASLSKLAGNGAEGSELSVETTETSETPHRVSEEPPKPGEEENLRKMFQNQGRKAKTARR